MDRIHLLYGLLPIPISFSFRVSIHHVNLIVLFFPQFFIQRLSILLSRKTHLSTGFGPTSPTTLIYSLIPRDLPWQDLPRLPTPPDP